MKTFLYFLIPLLIFKIQAQEKFTSTDISINKFVDGTLIRPNTADKLPLVVIIPDSGPTDRNGNQNFLKNNSLKKLAEGLAEENIASFRYDKRIIKEIRRGNVNLKVSFDDFVKDAESVLSYFQDSSDFENIYVIGHGQGSLVGMLAINENISGFISIAGAGKSLDSTLITQVQQTAPGLTDDTKRILEILKTGKTTTDYPEALRSIFDIEIQPFLMTWIKYDPSIIIEDIHIPILILSGTKDLQVSQEESKLMNERAPLSEISIIPNMNHVMFVIEGDDLENSKSYNQSYRMIAAELLAEVVRFIKKNG